MSADKQGLSRRQFLIGAGAAGAALAGASLAGCSSGGSGGSADGNAGTYTAIGDGRGGPLVVRVKMSADKIDSVEVVSNDETYNLGSVPIETYPDLIVKNQSINIDTVAGATFTSTALLSAVRSCIEQAGGNPDDFSKEVKAEVEQGDTSADVVVIGSGGAGMTAAVKAANAGKKVILLEKLGAVGGTSNFSIEGFGSVGDKTHIALGSPANAETLATNYTNQYPKGLPEAFTVFAQNAGAGADWLRSIGAELTVAAGQTSVASSREVGELGVAIVAALRSECDKVGVDTRVNSKVADIVMANGAVSGVKVSTASGDYSIATKAVIIASGGFGANNEMVSSYYAPVKGYRSSCSVGAAGDIHTIAEKLGASLTNMDYIRINFTYTTADNGHFYYMGSLFNTGAIFVNNDGRRFVNDQSGYGFGPMIVEQADGTGWGIFDSSIVKSVADVRRYGKLGLYESADTIEELADKIGVNKTNLVDTVTKYQGYVKDGKDPEFNRPMLNMSFDEPPFYACKVTCRVQGTFGGIATNTKAEVLKPDGTVIPGLYAAGECADEGTWGVNPASVNIVFGTIAGQNAAAYVG